MNTIIFDEDVKDFVYKVFNKGVDKDGYIVERDSSSRVITPEGDFVRNQEFAAIIPGSEVFVTNDMPSLLKHLNREAIDGQTV